MCKLICSYPRAADGWAFDDIIMLTIADCDLDALRIGQHVKLCFKPVDGGAMVPMFTPSCR